MECKICNNEFIDKRKLIKHLKVEHNISFEEYIIQFNYNGIRPTCQCGCNSPLKFHVTEPHFALYTSNHFPRKSHTRETKQKIKDSAKKYFVEKFGVENPMFLDEFKNKIKDTKLQKYGDSTYNNMEKNKQTKLEKYGNETYSNPEKIIETNLKKYGAKTFTSTEEGKRQVKKTKLEKYGDENFVNMDKIKETKKERYGYECEFGEKEFRLKHNRNNSNIEKEIALKINGINPFFYEGYEFDILKDNYIIEIDGDYWHPKTLNNLSFTTMVSAVNDYKKNNLIKNSQYKLLRINVSKLKNVETVDLDYIINNSYELNNTLDFDTIFLTKQYLESYILKYGKEKTKKYSKCILKFIRTFQKEFPFPVQTENINDVVNSINTKSKHIEGVNFNNNVSNVGVNLLKSNFKSYWNSSYKNKLSPKQAFLNDDVLLKIILYRMGMNDNSEIFNLSLRQILYGLSVNRYNISFFKPMLAANIYKTFLPIDSTPVVFDPCAGFGGRMLGFKSAFPNGIYIGVEPNIDTYTELELLAKNFDNVILINDKIENVDITQFNYIDLTFTSIPYYDLETYSQVVEYNDINDWNDTFLNKIKQLPNLLLNIPLNLEKYFGEMKYDTYYINSNSSPFQKNKNKSELLIKFNN